MDASVLQSWGRGPNGRTPALHAGGSGFDPRRLHLNNRLLILKVRYEGMEKSYVISRGLLTVKET